MPTALILHKETLRVLSAEQASTVGGAHQAHGRHRSNPCVLDSWLCCPTEVNCAHPTAVSKGCMTKPDTSLDTSCPI